MASPIFQKFAAVANDLVEGGIKALELQYYKRF